MSDEVTRKEFDDTCKTIVAMGEMIEQQRKDIKTQAEIMEQKEKLIADKLAEHEKKKRSLEALADEQEGDFPKFDPRGSLSPLRRAYESPRPFQKRAMNADTPADEMRLDFQEAGQEANFFAAFFGSRDKESYVTKKRNKKGDVEDFVNLQKLETVAPITVAKLRYYAGQIDPEYARAMDTGTELAAWLPTLWAASMIELVRAEYLVGGLFQHVTMPSATFEIPVEGGDLTPRLVGEPTADPMASDWHVGAITESDSTVASPALTARRFGCRSVISDDGTEDTILPVMPYISRKHVIAHAFALDEAILDGQRTGDIDTGLVGGAGVASDTGDRRYAWDGLRYIATQTKTGGNMDLSTFSYDNLVKLKGKMGVYGHRVKPLRFITGYSGLYQFLTLDEILTIDKYGPNATIVTGEAAKVLGIPIIIAPNSIYESMNASGIYDNSTTDYTILILVNTEGYLVGDRAGYTYKVLEELYAAHGMVGVVSYSRHGFVDLFPAATDVSVAYGYKIGKA